MKKIIWVDDDVGRMNGMRRFLFPKLWENNICNHIIFAGDDYAGGDPGELRSRKQEDDFTNVIQRFFRSFCYEWFQNGSHDDVDEMEFWESHKKLSPKLYFFSETDPKAVKEKIMASIDKIVNEDPDGDCYIGLDIRLFFDDEELKEETITMQLFYKYLTEKKYKVFLYSSFLLYSDVVPGWKKKFTDCHEGFSGKIRIYSRDKLQSLSDRSRDLLDFYEFLSIKEEEEETELAETEEALAV